MTFIPGSLVFVHRDRPMSRLIDFGQKRRFKGNQRTYAYWTHVAIIVSPDGDIVEALEKGVERNHISRYNDVPHVITDRPIMGDYPPPLASFAQSGAVIRFAKHAVGRKYGNLEILSLGLYLAIGLRLRITLDNQLICSALAAEALSRTDAIFPKEPLWMMPADLAEYYDVPGFEQ